MTASANSGHHKATEEGGNQGILGKRDLEKEMWTAGYKYSWRKMEAAAQDRVGCMRPVVCGLYSTGSDKAKVK